MRKVPVRSYAEFRFEVDGDTYSGKLKLEPYGRDVRVTRKTRIDMESERIVSYLDNPSQGYVKKAPTTKIGAPIKKHKTARISGKLRRQMNDDSSNW